LVSQLKLFYIKEVKMMVISTILFPVIAFGLAIGVGRIGTIIMDDIRKDMDFTAGVDAHHELKSEVRKSSVA
jgi:hypothetical protein